MYAGLAGRFFEGAGNGFAGIGDGEHAPVGFGLQRYAAPGKPRHGIGHAKGLEGRFELLAAARVVRHELRGGVAGVGHVAAPATRNAHFAQHLARLFQQQHLRSGVGFGAGNGGEKARRATAKHSYHGFISLIIHEAKVRAGGVAQSVFPALTTHQPKRLGSKTSAITRLLAMRQRTQHVVILKLVGENLPH